MNKFTKFFHELFNPHCTHCAEVREEEFHIKLESSRCRSCESLERQLAVANEQINKLTDKIVNPNGNSPTVIKDEVQPRPIHRGRVPFSVVRQSLEAESRAKAAALRSAAKPDSELQVQNNEVRQEQPLQSVSNVADTETVPEIAGTTELEDLVFNARTKRTEEITAGNKQ